MDVERGFKIKVGCLPHAATAFPQSQKNHGGIAIPNFFFFKIPNPDNPETVRTIHEFDHFFVLLSTFAKIS